MESSARSLPEAAAGAATAGHSLTPYEGTGSCGFSSSQFMLSCAWWQLAAPPQNKCDMDIFVFSQTRDPDLSVEVFLWIPIHLFDSRKYFAGSRKTSTTKNHWQTARMRSC